MYHFLEYGGSVTLRVNADAGEHDDYQLEAPAGEVVQFDRLEGQTFVFIWNPPGAAFVDAEVWTDHSEFNHDHDICVEVADNINVGDDIQNYRSMTVWWED